MGGSYRLWDFFAGFLHLAAFLLIVSDMRVLTIAHMDVRSTFAGNFAGFASREDDEYEPQGVQETHGSHEVCQKAMVKQDRRKRTRTGLYYMCGSTQVYYETLVGNYKGVEVIPLYLAITASFLT